MNIKNIFFVTAASLCLSFNCWGASKMAVWDEVGEHQGQKVLTVIVQNNSYYGDRVTAKVNNRPTANLSGPIRSTPEGSAPILKWLLLNLEENLWDGTNISFFDDQKNLLLTHTIQRAN